MQHLQRLAAYQYRPRMVTFLGTRSCGRWRAKINAITVSGVASDVPDIIEAAWDTSASVLRELPETELDSNIGFLTIHVGEAGVWLLIDRWEDCDILRHHHFRAPLTDPTRFADLSAEHYGPCVWELAVQAFERQAWLDHVLANPAGPDVEAYLSAGLTGSI
ncbi:hypothetical protein ACQR1W_06830 [Bradyrhizobium sp. HKCCYLS1011]|uniref:hypothetical protein n=1 Tax=Bradyrhizobium sp. HKCCYLS1011 TaxID=3420733 RepID=UPI003EBAF11D